MKTSREFTKSQPGRLRELGALAYQRELSAELARLENDFRRWRADEIDGHELCELIHRFHQGPARELFLKYDRSNLDFAVAHAVQRGLITEAEAGDAIDMLKPHLAFLGECAREDEDEEAVQQPPNPPPQRP